MACAIHGPDSLCGPECSGFIGNGNPATPTLPAVVAVEAPEELTRGTPSDNRPAPFDSMSIERCRELIDSLVKAHEETRSHIAEWVESVERRLNHIAANVHGYRPDSDADAKRIADAVIASPDNGNGNPQ